jgi:hypothetical protein
VSGEDCADAFHDPLQSKIGRSRVQS